MEIEILPNLMNAKQVAEKLNLKLSTVYKLTYQHLIPTVRIGGSVRFEPNAIRQFIKSHTVMEREK